MGHAHKWGNLSSYSTSEPLSLGHSILSCVLASCKEQTIKNSSNVKNNGEIQSVLLNFKKKWGGGEVIVSLSCNWENINSDTSAQSSMEISFYNI